MREIKFRVFDPNTDEMIVTGVGIGDISYYDFDGDNITEQEGLIIMQYTGLKDKNGVEIYEGDIVELGTKERFYVAWHDYKQEFTFRGYGGGYYPNTYRGATRNDEYGWEVIGNVHEQPHLLKGE